MTGNATYWTSGRYDGDQKSFVWVDDAKSIEFSDWDRDSMANQCVLLDCIEGGKCGWKNRNCADSHGVLCEVPKDKPKQQSANRTKRHTTFTLTEDPGPDQNEQKSNETGNSVFAIPSQVLT